MSQSQRILNDAIHHMLERRSKPSGLEENDGARMQRTRDQSFGGPSRRPSSRHQNPFPFDGGDGTVHPQTQIIQFPKQMGGWQHSKIVFGKGHSCINKLMRETGCNIVQPKFSDVRPEHKKLFPFFWIEGPTNGHVLDASVAVMKLLMTSMSRERFDLLKSVDELEEIVQHQKLKIADMEQAPSEYRPASPTLDEEPKTPPPQAKVCKLADDEESDGDESDGEE